MPIVIVEIEINAPADRVFDLSRCIDLHVDTMSRFGERAVGGVTSGLIEFGESVTWEATHLGISQQLKSVITKYDRPNYFQDSMLKGAFKSFVHDHYFESLSNGTLVRDEVDFESPFWIFGDIFNSLYLKNYVRKMILQRSEMIKSVAESKDWRNYLNHK